MPQQEGAKWAVGMLVLWGGLTALAEFPTTAPLAVALAWSIAIGATYIYGDKAFAELQKIGG